MNSVLKLATKTIEELSQPHVVMSVGKEDKDFHLIEIIEMHPNNMNRDGGFNLSKSCKPLLQKLKERRQSSNKKQ